MAELKKYTKDDVIDLELDELEILKKREEAFMQSGESLLDAIMNTPFKNKKKVDEIFEKIKFHKDNLSVIKFKINELKYTPIDYSNCNIHYHTITGISSITMNSNWTSTPSYISYSPPQSSNIFLKYIDVGYVNEQNDVCNISVVDDIFQSVLGNYYLTTNTGQILSLNRVVEIDEDSTLAKWYENMRRNFEREVKLNRIVKDDNDEKES